ncbi:hypothetical protein P59_201 [Bacillus phage P59]|nr:hypothetical protein P59_201 [Bacillus phage P59]
MRTYEGNDNYGKPKTDYVEKIAAMSHEELYQETKDKIWLSAFAANNPRSDYHWHTDVIYDEWFHREGQSPPSYTKAFEEVRNG